MWHVRQTAFSCATLAGELGAKKGTGVRCLPLAGGWMCRAPGPWQASHWLPANGVRESAITACFVLKMALTLAVLWHRRQVFAPVRV